MRRIPPSDVYKRQILFSGASSRMSPVSVPATAENIQRAVELIDRQEGGGGTEMAPALRDALAIPKTEGTSRSIITITDGYISGEKEIFSIISQNLADTDFFSFGIGDSVNRYLIDGIAKVGLGAVSYTHLDVYKRQVLSPTGPTL